MQESGLFLPDFMFGTPFECPHFLPFLLQNSPTERPIPVSKVNPKSHVHMYVYIYIYIVFSIHGFVK